MASRLVTVPRGGSTSAGNWVNRPSTSGSNRLASSRSCTRITSAFLLSLPPHDDSANNLKGDRVDKISRGKIYTSTFSVLDRPSSCSRFDRKEWDRREKFDADWVKNLLEKNFLRLFVRSNERFVYIGVRVRKQKFIDRFRGRIFITREIYQCAGTISLHYPET